MIEDQSLAIYSAPGSAPREWTIRPRRSGLVNLLRDLWDYRAIFGFIATQSIFDRHRKKLLGVAWMIIRPALMVVASVKIVGKVLGISTDPVPLVLFITVGMSLWWLFLAGVRYGMGAVTKGRSLIGRVSFPRFMLVLGALAPALVEAAVVFIGALCVFGYLAYTAAFIPSPGWHVLGVIPALLLVMTLVVALTCVTSILNSMAPDTAFAVSYGTSFLFFATPVAYPLTAVPQDMQWIFLLNPLAPALEIWRWALLGMAFPPWWSVLAAVATITLLLIGGLLFFLRWEQTLLDRS